jgi:hypothetical protein
MTDPMEFDRERAEQERAEGEQRALSAQRAQLWKWRAASWLDMIPAGREFVADDMIAVIGLPDQGTNNNNAVGAFFSAASRKGKIEPAMKMRKSERVARHGNRQQVWIKVGESSHE